MHYGHPPHTPSPDDLMIMRCRCGWFSGEMTLSQFADRGVPLYCDRCSNSATMWVRFHPSERAKAYDALGLTPPPVKGGHNE